jgi:hypothetical protein
MKHHEILSIVLLIFFLLSCCTSRTISTSQEAGNITQDKNRRGEQIGKLIDEKDSISVTITSTEGSEDWVTVFQPITWWIQINPFRSTWYAEKEKEIIDESKASVSIETGTNLELKSNSQNSTKIQKSGMEMKPSKGTCTLTEALCLYIFTILLLFFLKS